MNPILLRYIGFLLAAVIAGVGGGYLAVSKKVSPPPVTQSGTVPAVPAQPFSGVGVPAIPAIPAFPEQGTAKPTPPIIYYVTTLLNEVPAVTDKPGDVAYIFGSNFSTKAFNRVNWDGKVLTKDTMAFDNQLAFGLPDTIPLGSKHTVSVSTPFGTSNEIVVRGVEYWDTSPSTCGVKPNTGPTGTKVNLCYWGPSTPFSPVSERHFVSLAIPSKLIKSGKEGWITAFIEKGLEKTDGGWTFTVPKEVIYCPSFDPFWAEVAKKGGCDLAAPDTKVVLPPGKYHVDEWYDYQYQYKRFYGFAQSADLLFANGPWVGWYNFFTVTE